MMFVIPLSFHTRKLKGPTIARAKEKLDYIIRKNIICSFIAVISAFSGLIGLSTFMWLGNQEKNPDQESSRLWGIFCIVLDNFIGNLAVHAMTKAWLPMFLQHFPGQRRVRVRIRNEKQDSKEVTVSPSSDVNISSSSRSRSFKTIKSPRNLLYFPLQQRKSTLERNVKVLTRITEITEVASQDEEKEDSTNRIAT